MGVITVKEPSGAARTILDSGQSRIETIQTIAVADYADGDYFTLKDGTHSVLFEPREKAVTDVSMKAKASTADNETLIVDDGTNPAQTMEARITDEPTAATGSITCPALSSVPNTGDYITVDDGVNDPVLFEPRAKAQTSVAMKSLAAISDNETLIVDDGTNPAITYEAQKTPDAYAAGSITCPAKSAFLDNETVTLDDGVNDPVVFEFRVTPDVYATGSITCPSRSAIKNNETFVLDDGVNAPTTFIFNSEAAAAATGNIVCVAKANLKNNEQVTIGDGTHTVIFRFNTGVAAAAATGTITCVAKADLVNNDYFTITDATNGATVFEYKVDGSYAQTPGRVTIDVSSCVTDDEVAIATAAAINGVGATLTVQATSIAAEVVNLTSDNEAYAENIAITENVANGTFAVTGMTGGVTAFDGAGAEEVDISGDTTAANVATTLAGVINGVVGGLTVTATAPTDENVPLTNDANTYVGNVAITETVADAGFSVTGMTGGVTAFADGGNVEVDITGATDGPSVAAIAKTAIDGVVGGLAITCGVISTATIPLTNDAYGAYNDAISDTVEDAGFTHTGMTGGSSFTPAGGDVVVCDLTACTDGPSVAAALKASVNGVVGDLAITAGDITDATIALLNDAYGAYNDAIADTVTDGGFTHTGMTGGSKFTAAGGGVIVVDLRSAGTDEEAAQAFADAINVSEGSSDLNLTAGAAAGSVFLLTANATQYTTVAITGTALNTATTVSAGRGGAVPVVGAIEVDLTGTTTGAQHAALLKTAIENAADLDLTPGTISSATIPLTNDLPGSESSQNTAMTETGGTCYTLVGMTGGYEFVPAGGGVVVVDLRSASTDQLVGEAWAGAINTLAGTDDLNLTAGTPVGLDFTLTAKVTQSATVAVSGTALDSTATVSDGLGGVAVVGAIEVDMSGLTTAAEGAAKIAQVANAQGQAALAMTCVAAASGAFTTTLTVAGSYANDAPSTENVTNAGFTVTPTRAGADPISPEGYASLGTDGYVKPDELGPGGKLAADRVDFNGFLLSDIANDADPSVSGIVGDVGAKVKTIDGTKAWIKTGTGDTDWDPIHSS